MRHLTCAKATDAISAESAHMAAAESAAHVAAAAESATAVSTATTATAAGLGTCGKQAAGKHCARQNHHYSSSHDILHRDGRTLRLRAGSDAGVCLSRTNDDVDGMEIGVLAVASIKFDFN
jgi:hypothetical protein